MKGLVVLMPVYNDQVDMIKTLDSIKEEDNDFEVIIIDDGSVVPLTLSNNKYDFKVEIFRLVENKGITEALNTGLDLISKRNDVKYVARLDAGDVQVGNRLSKQYTHMEKNKNIKMIGGNVTFFDTLGFPIFNTNLPLTNQNIKREKYIRSCFIHPAVMFSKEIIDDGMRYSYDYPAAEDYEFFLRIIKSYHVENLTEILLLCHDRANGISIKKRRTQVKSVLRCLIKHKEISSIFWYLGIIKVLVQCFIPRSIFSLVKARLS
ncbi:glycosyltransferase [Aeromonas veronii]|uniref:glycosyltransferase n=1 Tax=Aeromonas veronii TaxID=654 RepID=UPI003007C017